MSQTHYSILHVLNNVEKEEQLASIQPPPPHPHHSPNTWPQPSQKQVGSKARWHHMLFLCLQYYKAQWGLKHEWKVFVKIGS